MDAEFIDSINLKIEKCKGRDDEYVRYMKLAIEALIDKKLDLGLPMEFASRTDVSLFEQACEVHESLLFLVRLELERIKADLGLSIRSGFTESGLVEMVAYSVITFLNEDGTSTENDFSFSDEDSLGELDAI